MKEPKSFGSGRTMGKSEMRAELIDQWNAECGHPERGFIFFSTTRAGAPVHPDSITTHTRRLSQKLGFHFSLHTLRHTFISKALTIIKADPKTVQSIAGHSDCRVTMDIYARSETEAKAEVQRSYEEYFIGCVSRPATNLNDADENFSLVSYAASIISTQNQISSRSKLDQKIAAVSTGTEKTDGSL